MKSFNLMTDKEQKAIETVNAFQEKVLEQTKDLRDMWYGLYLIAWVFKKLNKDFEADDNKNIVNKAFANIQTIKPRMFGRRPYFELYPRDTETDPEKVELAKEYIGYQWDNEEVDDELDASGDMILTYGTHIWQLGMDIAIKGKKKGEKIEPYVAYDRGAIEQIPCWEWLIDPKEKDLQKAPAVATYKKNILLATLQGDPRYDQEVLKQIALSREGGVSANDETDQVNQAKGFETKKATNLPVINELVEYWGLFEEEEGEPPVEYIIAVADKTHLLRFEANYLEGKNKKPFRPFVDFHDQKDPHSFFSVGEVVQIAGLQAVYNTFIRQRIENVRKILKAKWLIQKDTVEDTTALQTDTDSAIIEYNKNATQAPAQIKVADVTASLFNDLSLLASQINEISGVTDYAKGAEGGGDTATEAALNAEAANQRFSHKIRNLTSSIKKFIKMKLYMNAQFHTKEEVITIVKGEKRQQMTIPAFPVADVDVDVEEGSTIMPNSIIEQRKAQQLAQLSAVYPDPSQLNEWQLYTLKYQLRSLGEKNPDKILGLKDEGESEDDIYAIDLKEINDDISKMVQGQRVPVQANQNHELHFRLKSDFLSSEKAEGLSQEIHKLFMENLLKHYGYINSERKTIPRGNVGKGTNEERSVPQPNPQADATEQATTGEQAEGSQQPQGVGEMAGVQ